MSSLFPCLMIIMELLLIIFLICNIGEQLIGEFEMFEQKLCNCKWYLMSAEMQQLYLTFSLYAQQMPRIQCFGNISCTRETFKMVASIGNKKMKFNYAKSHRFYFFIFVQIMHRGFSYFMTLRQI